MVERTDKYLTFSMEQEQYAIHISEVREIIGIMPFTKVPNLPSYVKGAINLRGKIVPVIDLRLKFGLNEGEVDRKTSIIIIEMKIGEKVSINGIIVDEVKEVKNIGEEFIDEPPRFGEGYSEGFLTGIARLGENVAMILNVNKILSIDEIVQINKAI
jgi:purine-binding chemotaxis protein CheW